MKHLNEQYEELIKQREEQNEKLERVRQRGRDLVDRSK